MTGGTDQADSIVTPLTVIEYVMINILYSMSIMVLFLRHGVNNNNGI